MTDVHVDDCSRVRGQELTEIDAFVIRDGHCGDLGVGQVWKSICGGGRDSSGT